MDDGKWCWMKKGMLTIEAAITHFSGKDAQVSWKSDRGGRKAERVADWPEDKK